MKINSLKLAGTYAIHSEKSIDDRGFFMRVYDRTIFSDEGLQTEWQQESLSFNKVSNTVRGLHFQMPPFVETKVVRVLRGAIWDVFVDLRKASRSYGEWDAIELSAGNGDAVYIPAGFAHGFRTLEPDTLIEYKIDVPYAAECAGGIVWNDKKLNIDWKIGGSVISERDERLPPFESFDSPF